MSSDETFGGKRTTKITPHKDEEKYIWKKDIKQVDGEVKRDYVVYAHPSWDKQTREDMKTKYGFKWLSNRWIRLEPLDQDTIDEMISRNIIIQEGE
jgi:hypothetical protein